MWKLTIRELVVIVRGLRDPAESTTLCFNALITVYLKSCRLLALAESRYSYSVKSSLDKLALTIT